DNYIYKFPIHPLGRFNKRCAKYKQPVEIMSFSYDETHQLHMDDRELVNYGILIFFFKKNNYLLFLFQRYYYPPDLEEDCDLSAGYENFIKKNGGPDPIHSLL